MTLRFESGSHGKPSGTELAGDLTPDQQGGTVGPKVAGRTGLTSGGDAVKVDSMVSVSVPESGADNV